MDWEDCPAVEYRKDKRGRTGIPGNRSTRGSPLPKPAWWLHHPQFKEWFSPVEISQVEVVLQHQTPTLTNPFFLPPSARGMKRGRY